MGKRLFEPDMISGEKTARLGQPELLVIEEKSTDQVYYTIHKRYFEDARTACPVCGKRDTRTSKIVERSYRDILPGNGRLPRSVELAFAQRYYRCNACDGRVFPEEIEFAPPSARYTRRLARSIAEEAVHASYLEICQRYGIASKATVGAIIKRELESGMAGFLPLKTPETLAIIELEHYSSRYPLVLSGDRAGLYFIDLLPSASEDAYFEFFSTLDRSAVRRVLIEPSRKLERAACRAFPEGQILVSEECVRRHIREGFVRVIRSDGKRLPIRGREEMLTRREGNLSEYERKRVAEGLKERPRLRAAYRAYQDLMNRMDVGWRPGLISDWIGSLEEYLSDEMEKEDREGLKPLNEFDALMRVIETFEERIGAYLAQGLRIPENYRLTVGRIIAAVKALPFCTYDILRAHMLMGAAPVLISEGGVQYRKGIRAEALAEEMERTGEHARYKRGTEQPD